VSLRGLSVEQLIERARTGHRGAVGRLLSLAENAATSEAVTEATHSHSQGAHVVGITGSPGAGKSTMVGQLVAHLIKSSESAPAVLAVDPSSPLSGGAILGDRVRMMDVDEVAFIRSVATRGHAGGLAMAVPGCVRVFDAMAYDPVIIETVGVGQVEVDITAAADTTVVVVSPGMGDAVQANKAGLLEVADIFIVNKADRPGASDTRRDLELMLDLSHMTGQEDADYRPPIIMCNSLIGDAVPEIAAAIETHKQYLESSGKGAERKKARARFEVANRLRNRFEATLEASLEANTALLSRTANGELSPARAANDLAKQLLG
jgi:LAO/AO transport system kinase